MDVTPRTIIKAFTRVAPGGAEQKKKEGEEARAVTETRSIATQNDTQAKDQSATSNRSRPLPNPYVKATPRTLIRAVTQTLPLPEEKQAGAETRKRKAGQAGSPDDKETTPTRSRRRPRNSVLSQQQLEESTPRTLIRSLVESAIPTVDDEKKYGTPFSMPPPRPRTQQSAAAESPNALLQTPTPASGLFASPPSASPGFLSPSVPTPMSIPASAKKAPLPRIPRGRGIIGGKGRLVGGIAGRRGKGAAEGAIFAPPELPRALTKKLFQAFTKKTASKEAMEAVYSSTQTYFEHLMQDLSGYARHAHRKTITKEDVACLAQRQRLLSSKRSLADLAREYLPREYQEEFLAVARPQTDAKSSS